MAPHEARYWRTNEESTVVCELCPQSCRIGLGQYGRCSTRRNDSGRLTAAFYGQYASLANDPIEKKPLYQFYPGTKILSIGGIGCNLSCAFCQNWQISQPSTPFLSLRAMTPERFASLAAEQRAESVAFTYNEPSINAEFVIDAARECRRLGVRTVAVTNGMISGRAREEFYASLDAANIDLKAFSGEFYRSLCGGSFNAVKETVEYVARQTNVWLELTTLLIPGHNDSDEEIRLLAEWTVETCGVDTPLHFSAFFPTFRLLDAPATPPETLFRAAKIARLAGLKYVYCGNIADEKSQTTFCPQCGDALVERAGYRVKNRLLNALCPQCGEKIAGRF